MTYTFTEEEKRFVLAEIIKTSNLDIGHLVGFLKPYNIEPDWLKMQLPSGRTMEQCLAATEQMFQGPVRIPDLKRKSMNDLLEQPPKRLAVVSPMEPPTQLPPLAAATQGSASYGNPKSATSTLPTPPQLHSLQLANIQPRPMNAGVESGGGSSNYTSLGQPQLVAPLPRKRGRPSRAARQLRPLLPQQLTPLAPAPRPSTRESPSTPAGSSAYSLSPGPTSETMGEPPKPKRGRPRLSEKAQPGTLMASQWKTQSGRPMPNDPPHGRDEEIPRDSGNEREQYSDSQKERAISHIIHLKQEGLAR